jgi:hypothetical protein
MLGALTFLTPLGALVALAAVLPLAGLAAGEHRVDRARALLRLAPPADADIRAFAAALAAVPILLGVAAAQPAVRTIEGARARTDAEALFVFDTSRSMAAAARPGSPTRLARAKSDALRLRGAIPEVPSGVATLTDRVLPDLLPTADRAAFDSTVRHAVGIERPPPQSVDTVVTTLQPLEDVAHTGYYSKTTKHRVLVVLTDGESQPFSAPALARSLGSVALVLVHVWRPDEHVFAPGGRPEAAYRTDERSGETLDGLAAATGGRAVEEDRLGDAEAALRRSAGSGPTAKAGTTPRTRPLAPYVAAAAVLPLLFVLRRRNAA